MLDTRPGSLTPDAPLEDLGPLAWVFDELRKSLDGATKAIKRFVRETEQSRHNDLEAADPASLRIARQQLHQAVGALEMVGLGAAAQVLRGIRRGYEKECLRVDAQGTLAQTPHPRVIAGGSNHTLACVQVLAYQLQTDAAGCADEEDGGHDVVFCRSDALVANVREIHRREGAAPTEDI